TPSPTLFTKLWFMGTPELTHNETLISHISGNTSALHPSILTCGVPHPWAAVPLPPQPDEHEKIEEHRTLPLRFPLPLISTQPSKDTGKPRFKVGIEPVWIERRSRGSSPATADCHIPVISTSLVAPAAVKFHQES
ncbi:unnamed protein product, partial [Coregonus sp. 'balchen']